MTTHAMISLTPAAESPRSRPASAVGAANAPLSQRVPTFVPRDELFFWTHAWQDGERESAAEREAGNLRHFEDPNDLLRWLLTPED